MKPYYEDDAVTIYNADNREVLPALAGVGLVLTSPPYNLGNGEGRTDDAQAWTALRSGYADHSDDMPHDEYVAWQREVLALAWATLTDAGAIFYNHKPIARGNEVALPFDLLPPSLPVRQVITWDRGSGFCRNRTHYVPAYEWVILMAKSAFRITSRSVDDVWRIPFETGGEHPAPFPLKLATTAIGSTSADVILDPFMGSGTTLRAAKDLGRRAVGIELSERYCEIAAKRMGQEVLDFGGAA